VVPLALPPTAATDAAGPADEDWSDGCNSTLLQEIARVSGGSYDAPAVWPALDAPRPTRVVVLWPFAAVAALAVQILAAFWRAFAR
jgi:hypothetical protein